MAIKYETLSEKIPFAQNTFENVLLNLNGPFLTFK